MYSVKEVAGILGLTEHTIRFYTDKGLVPNLKRDRNHNRQFDEDAIHWLTMVKCLKACGMSIEAIKRYVDLCLEGEETVMERYQIILEQKQIAQQQLEEAQKRSAFLDKKVERYRDILAHRIPDTMNPGTWPVKEAN